MKTSKIATFAAIGLIGLIGMGNAQLAYGLSESAALGKAAGTYNGIFRGSLASFLADGSASLPGSMKLPRGKGAGLIIAEVRIPVKFTKVIVSQGGAKVTYSGSINIPASLTQGLGPISGPITATVTTGGVPKLKANSVVSALAGNLRASFSGSK